MTRDEKILYELKMILPQNFIAGASDEKILLFVDMVINDINWVLPHSNFTRETFPEEALRIIYLGCAYMAMLFKLMEVTLEDFNFNDSGLSVSVDQTTKINTAIEKVYKAYVSQVEYLKKTLMMRNVAGFGTPRYQSVIGQFLKVALGSAFNWTGR